MANRGSNFHSQVTTRQDQPFIVVPVTTFDDYFETMDSFNILSTTDIKKFKKTLLRKSFDINIASGLKNKIQFLIEVLANTSGKYFVDVEADQVNPLIYHISTDMDK